MKNFIKNTSLLVVLALLISTSVSGQTGKTGNGLSVTSLFTENLKNPIGLGVSQPRFSWQLQNKKRGTIQKAYELNVRMDDKPIWNSGRVSSDSSVLVAYQGPALKSTTRYVWDVKVWDNNSDVPAKSSTAYFHTGFFNIAEWKAKWIAPGYVEDSINRPSPYLRKEFNAVKSVKSAIAYITSHGMYEAYINGQRLGNAYYTPGWTSYKHRLQYQAYDVTNLIKVDNAVAVMLASGWYRGNIGWGKKINFYGKELALLLQIEIKYTDGTSKTVITDERWKSSVGKITYSEIYHGEKTDLRAEKEGWMIAKYNDSKWDKVAVRNFDKNNLIAASSENVKEQEVFKPLKVFTSPKGEKLIDFGQNLTGWVRMKVKGKAGQTVTLFHGEVLDKEGNFFNANLRAAKAEDRYTLKDDKEVTLHPHFTWHGFRYVKVVDYPGDLKPENFEAVALYSDIDQTGTFVSSNSMINQLQSNVQWGQKGNFLEIPTDCNQRNERLGWTGDIQIFAKTGLFNMRAHNFLAKWLGDVRAEQLPGGEVPAYIPDLGSGINKAAWADAITIVPWALYQAYGDKRALSDNYNSMKAYVESVRKITNNDYWDKAGTWGDWLAYAAEEGQAKVPKTSKYIIAQSYYANSVNILANSAKILGKGKDAEIYGDLLKRVKAAFQRELINANGELVSQSQADYIIALEFDMIPNGLEQKAADRLVKLINDYGHFTTGFLASPPLCHVLSKYGYQDLAFRLLERTEYPSWLYPITKGATTFWERWNGIMPDGSFQTIKPQSNSFSHYAHAAIGDFLYSKITGINTDETEAGVGYKHVIIDPLPGGSLTQAKSTLQTYYGTISSGWKIQGDKLILDIEIPVNTQATVLLPTGDTENITEGGKPIKSIKEIAIADRSKNNKTTLKLGSGTYQFTINRYTK